MTYYSLLQACNTGTDSKSCIAVQAAPNVTTYRGPLQACHAFFHSYSKNPTGLQRGPIEPRVGDQTRGKEVASSATAPCATLRTALSKDSSTSVILS